MNLIKTSGILVFMVLHFDVYSQDVELDVPKFPEYSFASMLENQNQNMFQTRLDSSFSFVGNDKIIHNQFSMDVTELSIQMKNDSSAKERFKVNSEMISNYCGPLQDGLYIPVKGEDVIVGRLMDFVINEYVVKKLIFNKGN